MKNILETVRIQIKNSVRSAYSEAIEKGLLQKTDISEIAVEIPREREHGDFSVNIAMQIAGAIKRNPRQIADIIIKCVKKENTYIDKMECAGPGFINFYLKNDWAYDALGIIAEERAQYGTSDLGKGKKVMVEFVSANPTGPLHMGNARGGALGDCIANVLQASGYEVTREFYVNDSGNQIEKFGMSLEARYMQQLLGESAFPFPEDGYMGEDIKEHAKEYINLYGDKLLNADSAERQKELAEYALPVNLERIKSGLKNYGVEFDNWFSEQSLYQDGEVDRILKYLKDKGHTYEKDGAVWFKASDFGSEKDEVLIRNNGMPTYFTSDIAYHYNKFKKRRFDRVINLLGADHYGHVGRMKAAVNALGIEPERLDIIIFQLVRLYRGGEIARMSKRTGRAITLEDLIEEVGRDAARFYFNMKTSGSHLDFDLDLAVKQSNENPVYYVQYAHARICSMMKLLEQEGVDINDTDDAELSLLKTGEELSLAEKLAQYPDEIKTSAETLEPSRLTRYALDVSALFHSFYNACRVKGEENELMKARLALVKCTAQVIRNILGVLSINAPERM